MLFALKVDYLVTQIKCRLLYVLLFYFHLTFFTSKVLI